MIVAHRTLKIRAEPADVPVDVRVFLPAQGDRDWQCRYEIQWPHGLRAFQAHGLDGMQALLLAFHMIAAELYASPYHEQRRLVWDEAGKGYGFPLPRVLRDEALGDDVNGP